MTARPRVGLFVTCLVDLIRPLLNEAVDLDHYKAAHQLGDAIVNAAKKAKSPSLVLELQRRVEEIKGIEKTFGKDVTTRTWDTVTKVAKLDTRS